ncbi:MAG: hypothetical protein Fur005_23070 [Roseiflexaceae bacterium]
MKRFATLLLLSLLAACTQPNPNPPTTPTAPDTTAPAATPAPTLEPSQRYNPIMPTATLIPEPEAESGRYTNREAGIALTYPTDWETESAADQGSIAWFYPSDRSFFVLLHVTVPSDPSDLITSAQDDRQASTNGLTEVEVVSETNGQLANGTPTLESQVEALNDGEPIAIQYIHTIIGKRMFVVMAFGSPQTVTAERTTIQSIATSLQPTSQLRYGIPEDQAFLMSGGESSNPRAYDPAHGGGGKIIFSGLTAFTPSLQLEPDLAESWDISADGTTYTFHIRRNARFHNGRPVTAADVIYSWDRAAAPETDSNNVLTYLGDIVGVADRRSGTAPSISGLRAIDDHTLEVRLDSRKPYFPMKLSYQTAFIVDQENIATGEEWYRTPNGTGPFRLIRWEEGKVRIYERFADFYLGPPKLPFIIESIYAGYDLQLYELGNTDTAWVGGFNLERARDPQGPFAGQLQETVSMCTYYIGIDSTKPPFDDPNVRQAFSYAVDRERLATLGGDQNIAAHGLYPPALPGYNTAMSGQTFDPARAKQLLAASSYGSADRLPPITFTSSGYGSSIRDSNAALADMWKQHLGVTIQFENLEPNRWSEALHDNKHGNLFSYGWCADYPDPENFADALFFSSAQENLGGYNNPELDQILIKARSEPDVATRIALYQQAEQHITEQAAAIFLYHSTTQLLIQPRVEGFVITPISIPIERYISIRTP